MTSLRHPSLVSGPGMAGFAGRPAALAVALMTPVVVWGELSPHIAIAAPWDKGAHLCTYLALAVLLTFAVHADRRTPLALGGLIGAGALLEVLQGWTGRDPSLADAAFNAAGAIVGTTFALAFLRRGTRPAHPEYFLIPAQADATDQDAERVLVHRSQLPDDVASEIERQLALADDGAQPSDDMGWRLHR